MSSPPTTADYISNGVKWCRPFKQGTVPVQKQPNKKMTYLWNAQKTISVMMKLHFFVVTKYNDLQLMLFFANTQFSFLISLSSVLRFPNFKRHEEAHLAAFHYFMTHNQTANNIQNLTLIWDTANKKVGTENPWPTEICDRGMCKTHNKMHTPIS